MTISIYYPDVLIPPSSNIDQVIQDIIKLLKDNDYNPIYFDIYSWDSNDRNGDSYISNQIYFELENLELEEDTINFLQSIKLYKEDKENINVKFDQTILIKNINEQVITQDKLIIEIEKLSIIKKNQIKKKDNVIFINNIDVKNNVNILSDLIKKINNDNNIEIKIQLIRRDEYKVDDFLASNSRVKEDNFSQKSSQKTVEDFYNEQNYEEINTFLNTLINDICVYLSKKTTNHSNKTPESINQTRQSNNSLENAKNENKEDLNINSEDNNSNISKIPSPREKPILRKRNFSDISESTPENKVNNSELFDSDKNENKQDLEEDNKEEN